MSRYAKAVLGALLAISTWGTTAAVDGSFDAVEWFGLLGAVATALGVYLAPNVPPPGEPADPMVSEIHPVDGAA